MMFWKAKRPPIDRDDEAWQLACWPWLLKHVVGLDHVRACPLIVPTDRFFAPTSAQGQERAEHIFRCVAELVGVSEWPFDLVAQDERVDPVLGPTMVLQNVPGSPQGTFSLQSDYRLQITYSPELVDDPIELIATYAHEICHALMLTVDRGSPEAEPPGGWENEEFATDLLVAMLGFGIFGANTAFQFQQYSDPASGMQGWSTRRSGYLTEAEWAFAMAVYLKITKQPADSADQWLKAGLAKMVAKSTTYLDKNPALLEWT